MSSHRGKLSARHKLGLPRASSGRLPRTSEEKLYLDPEYHGFFDFFDGRTAEIIRSHGFVHVRDRKVPRAVVKDGVVLFVEFYGRMAGLTRKEHRKVLEMVQQVEDIIEAEKPIESFRIEKEKLEAKERTSGMEKLRLEELHGLIETSSRQIQPLEERFRRSVSQAKPHLIEAIKTINDLIEGKGSLPKLDSLDANIALYFNKVKGYHDKLDDITKKPLSKMHIIFYAGRDLLIMLNRFFALKKRLGV